MFCAVTNTLGALAADPPAVDPKVRVLAAVSACDALKPPVPLQVKLVAVAISTTVPALPLAISKKPEPNCKDLTLELLELNSLKYAT